MPLITWDNSYSIGVLEMDQEHQKLLGIINSLYDAMREKKSKEVLAQTFQGLADYTKEHFGDEEVILKKINYPDLNIQLAQHAEFTKKVNEYNDKFKRGELFVSVDVLTFLKDWLINHICKLDKKYGDFINSKK
jgi:hemerythrin